MSICCIQPVHTGVVHFYLFSHTAIAPIVLNEGTGGGYNSIIVKTLYNFGYQEAGRRRVGGYHYGISCLQECWSVIVTQYIPALLTWIVCAVLPSFHK